MTREMEAYWETKRRIERRLLIGVWAVLLVVWTAACGEAPSGPYTRLGVGPGPVPPVELPADDPEFRCGDIQISHDVCEKGLGSGRDDEAIE